MDSTNTDSAFADSTIVAFRFTLRYAELLVADIDDDQMAVQPHSGMNHPAWVLGHYALGADFVAQLLGQPLLTDDDWMAMFGPGSTPTTDRTVYPSKDALLDTARKTHARAIELMTHATPEQLAAPNATPFFPEVFPTTGDLLTHLLTTHGALHLGQLSAWRRSVGKSAVLGI